MQWIKYQILQSKINGNDILIDKKVGYNEANLAIAEIEAYNGQYEIIEDDKDFEKEPLAIELGGTGVKTLEALKNKLGVPKITHGLQSAGYPSNPIEGQIHIFYEE